MPTGIQELYNQAIITASITDSMAISNFLNPVEEARAVEGQTTDEELLEEIIEGQLGHQNSQNDDEEECHTDIRCTQFAIKLKSKLRNLLLKPT
ncbi:hypothetical protein GMDG_08964, partial [Pseudogymnoascus destructans 20631-21]